MTEKEFWEFMEEARSNGRVNMVSGRIDSQDPQTQVAGEYMGNHSLLPANYDRIPEDKLIDMGNLLFDKEASLKAKEIILVILAHQSLKSALRILQQYNKNPDNELKFFAEFALDECRMWQD